MNKRKRLPYLILTILIVSILLLTSIGLSLWIISDKKEIKPELGVDKVLVQYLDNQKPTYTGDILLPSNNVLDLNINNEDLTYYYKGQSDPDFIKVDNSNPEDPKGPINAGEYTIKVEYNYEVYEFDDELQKDVLVEKTFIKDNIQFEILKDIIRVEDFGFVYTKEYNTKEQTITHTSIPKGATSVSYTGALTNVGTTNVTINIEYDSINYQITENGENVNGVLSKTFEITPYDISKLSFKFEGNTNDPNNLFYYRSGNKVADLDTMFTAVHTLLDSTEVIVPKDQYTISFPDYTTIGEYKATITAVENKNYTSSTPIEYEYKIVASPLTIKFEGKSLVNQFYQFDFCGEAIAIASYINVYDAYGTPLTNLSSLGISISYQYSANAANNYSNGLPTNAGLYQVKVTATVSGTPALYANKEEVFNIQILAIQLSASDVTASVTTTYPYNNGNAITVGSNEFSVSHSTYTTLTYGTHYVIDTSKGSSGYDNNKDAGTNTAIVYLKFIGNFTGDFQTTFTITPVTPTVTPGTFSHIYYIEGQFPEPQSYGSATYNGSSVTSGTMSLTGYTHNGTNYNDLNSIEYTVNATMQQAVTATFTYTPTLNTNNVYNYNPASATVTLYFCAAAGNVTKKLYYPTIYDAIYNSSSGDKVWVVAGLDTINLRNTGVDVKLIPELDKSVDIKSGVTFGLSYLTGTAQGATDSTAMQQGYYEFYSEQDCADGQQYRPTDGIRTFMKINSGVKLTANSGGTLVVGGYIHYDSVIENPTVIMNDGIITIESGAVMNSFGFTKGQGTVHLEDGSTCNDSMRIYDFAGTRWAVGLYYQKVFRTSSKNVYNYILPFQSYSLHNISCELYIHSGSQMIVNLSMGINNKAYVNKIPMFGEDALFTFDTPAVYDSNHNIQRGYARRTVRNTVEDDEFAVERDYQGSYDINGDYYSTNTFPMQQEVYEFYTDVSDTSITINLKMIVEILGAKIEVPFEMITNANIFFPVCMFDVTIKSGYTMCFDTNSYKVLPGSKVTVEEGAAFLIGINQDQSKPISMVFYDQLDDRITADSDANGIYWSKNNNQLTFWWLHKPLYENYDKADENPDAVQVVISDYQAKIINNGILNVTGKLSGVVETKSDSANISFANNNATIKEVTKLVGLEDSELAGYVLGTGVKTNSEFDDRTYNLRMYMKNGDLVDTNLSTPAVGSYTSYRDSSGKYGWRPRYININIILNGGRTLGGVVGTYTIANIDSTGGYVFTKDMFDALGIYKTGYSIGTITYNDSSGGVVNFSNALYDNITIFINWSLDSYTITYKNVYDASVSESIKNAFGESNFTINPNSTSATILETISLSRPTITDGETSLSFEGWFTNPECTGDPISSLENISSDITLYAYWIESDEAIPFTVVYNGPTVIPDGSKITSDMITIPASEVGGIINNNTSFIPTNGLWGNINNIETITHYMDVWYFDANCEQEFTKDALIEMVLNAGENPTINLYSKLSPKYSVTYQYKDGSKKGEIIYKTPGSNMTLETYSYDNTATTNYVVFYDTFKWSSSLGGEYENGADNVKITDNVIFTESYDPVYYVKTTFSLSNATVAVSVTNGDLLYSSSTAAEKKTSFDASSDGAIIYIKEGSTVSLTPNYTQSSSKLTSVTIGSTPVTLSNNSFTMASIESDSEVQVYTITATSNNPCIVEGTLITLANGSNVPVEQLTGDELLLVWNHTTGKMDVAKIAYIVDHDKVQKEHEVMTMYFNDGTYIKIIGEHVFYDVTLNKYVAIDSNNYHEFIGHTFLKNDGNDKLEQIEFIDVEIKYELTRAFEVVTNKHLVNFTNDILSTSAYLDPLLNVFDINNETYAYNLEQMMKDIEEYGLYTYEDFEGLIDEKAFELYNAAYLKVAVGKGYITWDDIIELINIYYNNDVTPLT